MSFTHKEAQQYTFTYNPSTVAIAKLRETQTYMRYVYRTSTWDVIWMGSVLDICCESPLQGFESPRPLPWQMAANLYGKF